MHRCGFYNNYLATIVAAAAAKGKMRLGRNKTSCFNLSIKDLGVLSTRPCRPPVLILIRTSSSPTMPCTCSAIIDTHSSFTRASVFQTTRRLSTCAFVKTLFLSKRRKCCVLKPMEEKKQHHSRIDC